MSAPPAPQKKIIRTAVFIDGYNLYYGRLRGSIYKWLDVVRLFEDILANRDQNESLVQMKVFTAHALANFATNKAASIEAQLANAQMPVKVPTNKKPILKPAHW